MGYEEKVWLKHYEANVPASLEYPHATLSYFLERAAKEYPSTRALSYLRSDKNSLSVGKVPGRKIRLQSLNWHSKVS